MQSTSLQAQHCRPLDKAQAPLENAAITGLLEQIHADWQVDTDGLGMQRRFRFQDYYQTIAFVNALAWVAHQEDHHPDLKVSYNQCQVHYSTHSVGGLSLNDFICAAKIDAL